MTTTGWYRHVVGWVGEGQAAIEREKWSSLLRNSMVEFSVDTMGVQTWFLVWKLGMKNQRWLTFNDLGKACILMSLVTHGFPQRANMELVYGYFVVSCWTNRLVTSGLRFHDSHVMLLFFFFFFFFFFMWCYCNVNNIVTTCGWLGDDPMCFSVQYYWLVDRPFMALDANGLYT